MNLTGPAVKDPLRVTSAKVSKLQLQAGVTNIPADEDPGAARPKTPPPMNGVIEKEHCI